MALKTCPTPRNEEERLQVVHRQRVLDTAPEPAFDAITKMALKMFGSPMATVGMIDAERLWFKSRAGAGIEDYVEIDRNLAFCSHTTLDPERVIVVEDAFTDSRFSSNPLVTGPFGIRFYAGAPIHDGRGHVLGTVAVFDKKPRHFSDEDKELLKGLATAAMTALDARRNALDLHDLHSKDELTGVLNRPQFQLALSGRHLSAAKMDGALGGLFGQREPLGVLCLSVDGLKTINELLGYNAGDATLRAVAKRLVEVLEPNEIIARLGGDKFAVLMPQGASATEAVSTAQKLIAAAGKTVKLANGRVAEIGISVGVAVEDAGKVSAEALLNEADAALLLAKDQQTQRWFLLRTQEPTKPDQTKTQSSYSMSPVLRLALRGRHSDHPIERTDPNCPACIEAAHQPFPFTMAFQPIVDTRTKSIFAYEALVRGPRGEPAHSVLARVNRRNRYAFDQNCRRLAIELAQHLDIQSTGAALSVNFIPGAINEPKNCVRATVAVARRVGLPLSKLIFEVTEGEEVVDPQQLKRIFDVYRSFGFRPAIDDFGSGHANLSLLAEFQPAIIKIDRKLVTDIHTNKVKQTLVGGILRVCQELKITTVAEGIEHRSEWLALQDLGVDLFQGFLFAGPELESLPGVEFP